MPAAAYVLAPRHMVLKPEVARHVPDPNELGMVAPMQKSPNARHSRCWRSSPLALSSHGTGLSTRPSLPRALCAGILVTELVCKCTSHGAIVMHSTARIEHHFVRRLVWFICRVQRNEHMCVSTSRTLAFKHIPRIKLPNHPTLRLLPLRLFRLPSSFTFTFKHTLTRHSTEAAHLSRRSMSQRCRPCTPLRPLPTDSKVR